MNYVDSIYLNEKGTAKFKLDVSGANFLAYRVSEDAEKGIFLFDSYEGSKIKIKAADHVFGGKDFVVDVGEEYTVLCLDINPYIQRTGEYKGCILLESSDESASCELVIIE